MASYAFGFKLIGNSYGQGLTLSNPYLNSKTFSNQSSGSLVVQPLNDIKCTCHTMPDKKSFQFELDGQGALIQNTLEMTHEHIDAIGNSYVHAGDGAIEHTHIDQLDPNNPCCTTDVTAASGRGCVPGVCYACCNANGDGQSSGGNCAKASASQTIKNSAITNCVNCQNAMQKKGGSFINGCQADAGTCLSACTITNKNISENISGCMVDTSSCCSMDSALTWDGSGCVDSTKVCAIGIKSNRTGKLCAVDVSGCDV